jgi:uracil-DNA glycosylase
VQNDWANLLENEFAQPYYADLQAFVARERVHHNVYPSDGNVFAALQLTSYANTRVLLLGQDPYHGAGQAHGLCFSVQDGVRFPPSLRNIFTELHNDIGSDIPSNGNLTHWAEQGVLMLNTTLTVREGEAGSHQAHGWETLTDHIISLVNQKEEPVVFVLWGAHARKKRSLIINSQHTVIESAHPSPLSARNGFFGSKPFSRINEALLSTGQSPIEWSLRNT